MQKYRVIVKLNQHVRYIGGGDRGVAIIRDAKRAREFNSSDDAIGFMNALSRMFPEKPFGIECFTVPPAGWARS